MAQTSSMLTLLLDSLHTHLQSQTRLLPTLHAQLGLPPTAIEDELKMLEQQLIKSVEDRVDARRGEVEKWMEKCDAVENECLRYSKALGGNVKVAGSSVGELRKEQVLPRRFDMVSEYQEKLRQLYHTKLEQLKTLTNRLNALAHILGADYYKPDILGPASAQDEDTPDVAPERFLKLEKELVRGKTEVTKRLNQLSAMFVQIDWLYTELGMAPPSLDDLPSSSSTTSLTTSLSIPRRGSSSNLTFSDPFAVSTPTPASRLKPITPFLFQEGVVQQLESEYQRIFARFVARIEEADNESLPESQTIPIGLESVDPTPGLLSWAANLCSSLEETKRQRETHIQAVYDQLEGLWKRLGVGEADMDAFVEAHRGSTEEAVREYEEELERMLELKRERMSVFVQSAREEIMKLWDDLMVGKEERADFAPFADDEHTEELLSIHEDEIRRLKEERRMKAPLLASIKKYFDICEEEKELAAAASDQTRLLGRGRDPGRLLREEKMRKRVSKEKPRLEQDLLASIPIWEQEANRPFLVHGQSILQVLMETLSAADQENRRKPPRAGSVPPRATTPVNSLNAYVPGSKSGVVTPAIRPGSASQSVPNKRQKLGEPTTLGHQRQGSSENKHTPGYGRAPLSSYKGGNGTGRAVSPSKIPGKISNGGQPPLPRSVALGMLVPKLGSQYHALGHGRLPSGIAYAGYNAGGRGSSSISGLTSSGYGGRSVSGSNGYGTVAASKKDSRARRESFKPRPSVDTMDRCINTGLGGQGGRWAGPKDSVREEDEGY